MVYKIKNFAFFLAFICANFYNFTVASAIENRSQVLIKIGLQDYAQKLYISANEDFEFYEIRNGQEYPLGEQKANEYAFVKASPAASGDMVIASAPYLVSVSSKTIFRCKDTNKDCIFQIQNKQQADAQNPTRFYRGSLEILPNTYLAKNNLQISDEYQSKKFFRLLNVLALEKYLYSVVASEMPSSWQSEALQAQAIAARTYSYKNLTKHQKLGYDLKAGVQDQAYFGYNKETKNSIKAVKASTKKVLVNKQGFLIDTFYSSHSGTATAFVDEAWGLSPKSYLTSVNTQHFKPKSWTYKKSWSELSKKFAYLKKADLNSIQIQSRSADGRVAKVLLGFSSGKQQQLSGEEFRHSLKLRSTFFDLTASSTVIIKGIGFGHGIGMSQYGANYLAQKKLSAKEILTKFYADSLLVTLP